MPEPKDIDRALQLGRLNLPASPKVVKLAWDIEEDSSGDECLYIDVVFDDQTTDQEIEQGPVHAIKRAIMDSLDAHHVSLLPIFWFMRESEQRAPSGGA